MPVADLGYLVLEDTSTEPSDPPEFDPDQYTNRSLAESEKTQSTFSGSGQASGARVLLTGGVTKAVDTKDPACENIWPQDFLSKTPTGGIEQALLKAAG